MTTKDGAALSIQARVPAANSFRWGVSTSSFQIEAIRAGANVKG
jgi:beta-glucosidase